MWQLVIKQNSVTKYICHPLFSWKNSPSWVRPLYPIFKYHNSFIWCWVRIRITLISLLWMQFLFCLWTPVRQTDCWSLAHKAIICVLSLSENKGTASMLKEFLFLKRHLLLYRLNRRDWALSPGGLQLWRPEWGLTASLNGLSGLHLGEQVKLQLVFNFSDGTSSNFSQHQICSHLFLETTAGLRFYFCICAVWSVGSNFGITNCITNIWDCKVLSLPSTSAGITQFFWLRLSSRICVNTIGIAFSAWIVLHWKCRIPLRF